MSNIKLKTDTEIALMRTSGKILAGVLTELEEYAKPGVTTLELDQLAEKLIRKADATPSFKGYKGYPFTLCTSINEEVVHTFPSIRKLQEGDILTIDCGVFYQGFHTDSATTFGIGKISREVENFIEDVRAILYGAINLVQPGQKIGTISNYIEHETKKSGYNVLKDLIGHGIGTKLHEPPEVPNFGKAGTGPSLVPGMTFCIEPIIGFSSRQIDTQPDQWSIVTRDGGLACQQEHTVLVTPSGFEVLTLRESERTIFE